MKHPFNSREEWLQLALKISGPVLTSGAKGALSEEMPVETHPGTPRSHREQVSPLEALGRTMAGIAPWLSSCPLDPKEDALRREYCSLARDAIARSVDPGSGLPFRDKLRNGERSPYFPHQSLVDASYLARAILYAKPELWDPLSDQTKSNVIACMKQTYSHRAYFNNWLLFAGVVDVFLISVGSDPGPSRIDFALRQTEQWYVGDGLYKDGEEFHWDYYNSLVIHPYLLDIASFLPPTHDDWKDLFERYLLRAHRYCVILERLIAPDGSFPTAGRSASYRCGAFHLLSYLAWAGKLPENLSAGQVRAALSAVIAKTLSPPETFDDSGWLRIGVCGHQPRLAENYISTGSLYKCLAAFMPLGLRENDPFWVEPWQPHTGMRVWAGDPMVQGDHPLGW